MQLLLTDKQVAQMLCIGRSTVWAYAEKGILPKPLKLSKRSTRWKYEDILLFIDKKSLEEVVA